MNRERNSINCLIIAVLILLLPSCSQDWFDVKPDSQLAVPTTYKDLQALLDNTAVMNDGSLPTFGEESLTDYYLTDVVYSGTLPESRNTHIWSSEIYDGNSSRNWNAIYQQVLYANVVLDGLDKIREDEANRTEHYSVKGSALYFRSHAYFQLLQVFAKPYIVAT